MELIILKKVITIFLIILVGYGFAKKGVIDENTKDKMSILLTNLINPLRIFTSFQMEYSKELIRNMLYMMFLTVSCFMLALLVVHIFLHPKREFDFAVEKYSVMYSNYGNIGLPLAMSLFGEEGVIYTTVCICIFNVFIWTHGVSIMSEGSQERQFRKFLNPAIAAVFLGLFVFLLRIQMPAVLYDAANYIGSMSVPVAMLVAGAVISRVPIRKMLEKRRLYYVSFLKLLLIPILFIMCIRRLPINETVKITAALDAACPTAAYGTILAVRYHRDEQYAVELFAVMTILSILTIPICILFV